MAMRAVHNGFTERFKLALGEAGYGSYTLKGLGALFGVSGQAVKKWMAGDAIPSAERMAIVAETLGVRRAWLLDNEQPMRSLAGVDEAGKDYSPGTISLSGDEFKMLSQYRSLPHRLQQNIANLIANLRQELDRLDKRC